MPHKPRQPTPHRPPPDDPYREHLQQIVANGRIIRDGAILYCRFIHAGETDQRILAAAKQAFEAGASSLFQVMTRMSDRAAAPTDADMRRMDALHNEAMAIDQMLHTKYGKPIGSA